MGWGHKLAVQKFIEIVNFLVSPAFIISRVKKKVWTLCGWIYSMEAMVVWKKLYNPLSLMHMAESIEMSCMNTGNIGISIVKCTRGKSSE